MYTGINKTQFLYTFTHAFTHFDRQLTDLFLVSALTHIHTRAYADIRADRSASALPHSNLNQTDLLLEAPGDSSTPSDWSDPVRAFC